MPNVAHDFVLGGGPELKVANKQLSNRQTRDRTY